MSKSIIGHYDIGEMVRQRDIDLLNTYANALGKTEFYLAVWEGLGAPVAYAYIHPCDEMRETKNFKYIQEAFIRAYV